MAHTDRLISVVVPAYNYAALLPRAVESVVGQLDDDCELLVVDDGSTDDTPGTIQALHARYPGLFGSVRKANAGLSSTRNVGIAKTNGRFLVFLDADDELTADALAILKRHIAHYPETRFVIGGYYTVSNTGERKQHLPGAVSADPKTRLRDYLIDKRISLSNGACAMHREIFSKGVYPEQFRSAEDIPVFAQALAAFPCSVLRYPLATIHKHDDSLRHNLRHALDTGLLLVDEVFSPQRLDCDFHQLRKPYYVQRSLSMFRTCLLAGDNRSARAFYLGALRSDWRSILKFSYTRKALRLLLSSIGTRT